MTRKISDINVLLATIAMVFVLNSCETPSDSGHENVKFQMGTKPSAQNSSIDIVYLSAEGLNVMDSNGGNQKTIWTPNNEKFYSPTWGPQHSVSWVVRQQVGWPYANSIKAVDVDPATGEASNYRHVYSMMGTFQRISSSSWSSSIANKIAFAVQTIDDGSSTPNYVCVVSANGGTPDTLYTVSSDQIILGVAWSPDDSRIAVGVQTSATRASSFVILDASTGAVTDSIPVGEIIYGFSDGNHFEWSRSGLNKLVFVAANGNIHYLTPSAGSTPTTNNVGTSAKNTFARPGSVTWSPTNSNLLYIKAFSGDPLKSELMRNKAQTSTVKSLQSTFKGSYPNWRR